MTPVLLMDFGSTRTKVTAVDLASHALLGTASAPTTVETDVAEGLEQALRELAAQAGSLEFTERFACSSAAGGLRMVASGLVPGLTAEAARLASLGAGARVIKIYSYQLTAGDLREIEEIQPDIFLLTGGTDGGNAENILHNAEMLASCKADFPILVAGNRSCAEQCCEILAGRQVRLCENVMPKIDQLNIEPVQNAIRELFLERIVLAKGLSKLEDIVSGIMMPTPSAVRKAVELLSSGTAAQSGFGDLMALDIGGATTDVYSVADGLPDSIGTIYKGLPEPRSKRTVEGDLGMRYGALGVLEAVGAEYLAAQSGLPADSIPQLVEQIISHPAFLPESCEEKALDYAIACGAAQTAAARHAGTLEQAYTPTGPVFVQTGKDLSRVETLVVTGGPLIHTNRTAEIAEKAFANPAQPMSLRPKRARILTDHYYILAAMGLFSEKYPDSALTILKNNL